MGIPVLIIGKSGSGKSRSMKNCVGKDFALIKVINKPLPFRGKIPSTALPRKLTAPDGKVYRENEYNTIRSILLNPKCPKSIVIDDAGYLITGQFMDNHSNYGKGNDVFRLYNNMADNFYKMLQSIINDAPDDRIVYIIMHEDTSEFGEIKAKTIGKLLDEKVCIEGMCTIVIRAKKSTDYVFVTQSQDGAVSKSPEEMFEDIEIPNDLLLVDNAIREYYGIENQKNKEEQK